MDPEWIYVVTNLQYVHNIFYLINATQKRSEHGLSSDHLILVIFDQFKGQCTEVVLKTLKDNNIDALLVPANCTNRLLPLDISVNKAVKDFLHGEFQSWYADQVKIQLQNGRINPDVNLS